MKLNKLASKFRKRSKIHIGLDFQERGTSVVAIQNFIQLANLQSIEPLSAIIATLSKEFNNQDYDVILGISAQNVMIQEITLHLSGRQLSQHLNLYAQKYFGHDLRDLVIQTIQHSANLRIVAAQRKYIQEIINVCRQSKLIPKAIDVDAFGFARALAYLQNNSDGLTVGILPRSTYYLIIISQQEIVLQLKNIDFVHLDIQKNMEMLATYLQQEINYWQTEQNGIERITLASADHALQAFIHHRFSATLSINCVPSNTCALGLALRGLNE